LFKALKQLNTNNAQNEYYLTDVIQILKEDGHFIEAYCTEDYNQALGINTRMDQARINKIIYQRNNQHFMTEGVTIVDPDSTFIDSTVKIGFDTIVYPFSVLKGQAIIGKHCHIGPYAYVADAHVADSTKIAPFKRLEKEVLLAAKK